MGCAGSKSDDVGGGGGGGGGQGGYDDQGQEDDYNPLTQDEVNARIQCSDAVSYTHLTLPTILLV